MMKARILFGSFLGSNARNKKAIGMYGVNDLLVLTNIGMAVLCEDGGIAHSSLITTSLFFAIFHGDLRFLSKERSNLQSISLAAHPYNNPPYRFILSPKKRNDFKIMLATTTARTLRSTATRHIMMARGSAVPTAERLAQQRRNYHENIVEHYENPRNVGSLDKNSDDVGTVSFDSVL